MIKTFIFFCLMLLSLKGQQMDLLLRKEISQDKKEPLKEIDPKQGVILSNYVEESSYRIFPGDVFYLEIFGLDMDPLRLIVNPEGNLVIPKTGIVQGKGLILKEFIERTDSLLKKKYPKSEIIFSLVQPALFDVYISGEVLNPGKQTISNGQRVSETIKLAGGFTEKANRFKVVLERKGIKDTLDLSRYYYWGEMETNFMIEPLDRLHVTGLTGEKYILDFSVKKKGTLKELIAEKRFSPGNLDFSKIKIKRNDGNIVIVNLYYNHEDILLNEKDSVFFKKTPKYIYVEGEVANAGAYVYDPGLNVQDYVGMSGLLMSSSRKKTYKVVNGKKVEINSLNMPVYPGEIIVVPANKKVFIKEYVSIISTLVSLTISTIALTK